MTTLAIMKTRIAKELRRTGAAGINDDIEEAIYTAIEEYQSHRLTFNESRNVTFLTVADQDLYDESDEADLATIIEADFITMTVDDNTWKLCPGDAEEIELQTNASSGMPSEFVWYGGQLRLWPAPATAGWTVRVTGHVVVAAPATETDENNPWMVKAEKLIRCRAKRELALHRLRDPDLAALMGNEEMDALNKLERRHNQLVGTGRIRSMEY